MNHSFLICFLSEGKSCTFTRLFQYFHYLKCLFQPFITFRIVIFLHQTHDSLHRKKPLISIADSFGI